MAKPRKVIISCAATGTIHTFTMTPCKLSKFDADQVTVARALFKPMGPEIATPDEVREILDLEGGDQVAF